MFTFWIVVAMAVGMEPQLTFYNNPTTACEAAHAVPVGNLLRRGKRNISARVLRIQAVDDGRGINVWKQTCPPEDLLYSNHLLGYEIVGDQVK